MKGTKRINQAVAGASDGRIDNVERTTSTLWTITV